MSDNNIWCKLFGHKLKYHEFDVVFSRYGISMCVRKNCRHIIIDTIPPIHNNCLCDVKFLQCLDTPD